MCVHSQYETVKRYLINKGYWMALEALEYAERFHTGTRRNGDHEFSHPLEVAIQIIKLIEDGGYIQYPEETIAAALLHDVPEDYGVTFDVFENKFGAITTKGLKSVTKEHLGFKYSFSAKMYEAAHDPVGSIVKPSDRLHNLKTLYGAFTLPQALEYIEETNGEIIPAMKLSMTVHPKQAGSVSFFLSGIRSAAQSYLSSPLLTAAE